MLNTDVVRQIAKQLQASYPMYCQAVTTTYSASTLDSVYAAIRDVLIAPSFPLKVRERLRRATSTHAVKPVPEGVLTSTQVTCALWNDPHAPFIYVSNSFATSCPWGVEANVNVRYWHDSLHYRYNLDDSTYGEIQVAEKQLMEWVTVYSDSKKLDLAALIILIDSLGQTLHFELTGSQVDHQQDFIESVLAELINLSATK